VTEVHEQRLAVFFDAQAVSIMSLVENLPDRCRLVWVVGWSVGDPAHRMLARFGDVVDVTGLNEDESASRVVSAAPDGVVVFNDAPIMIASRVATQLGLSFHDPHTALLLTDKFEQRTALSHAGITVPAFAGVSASDEESPVPFPAVLKPRHGAGSRDTFVVDNFEQVKQILTSVDSSEEFVLEEWLADRPGPRRTSSDIVSVESVVQGDAIDHVTITGRFVFAPPCRETGSFVPSDVERSVGDDVRTLAGDAIRALGIRSGIVHTEIKVTPSGPRVIEVNGRLGGAIGQLVTRVGGPSLTAWAMRLALGREVGRVPGVGDSPVAYYRMIVPPVSATRFVEVTGVESLRRLAGVEDVQVNLRPGQSVDYRRGSWSQNALRIVGAVENHDDLSLLIDHEIPSALQLTWESDGDSSGHQP